MRSYDPAKPLISIHVPKSAGTTFQLILRQWFGRKLLVHYIKDRPDKKPKKHRITQWLGGGQRPGICIHGHFNKMRGFGIDDYYPSVDQFITILRDPFETALSRYFFAKYRQTKPEIYKRPDRAADQYDSLEAFLDGARNSLMDFLPDGITLENHRQELQRRFVYMGIAEDMPTSIARLGARLGFAAPPVEHHNASPRDEPIPAGAEERFRQAHALEYAIYDFAREMYQNV